MKMRKLIIMYFRLMLKQMNKLIKNKQYGGK